jgi:hypothetical protein
MKPVFETKKQWKATSADRVPKTRPHWLSHLADSIQQSLRAASLAFANIRLGHEKDHLFAPITTLAEGATHALRFAMHQVAARADPDDPIATATVNSTPK